MANEWILQDTVGFEFKETKIIEYLQRHIAKAAMEFASKVAAE
jgi:hypothetical protein